MADNSIIQGEIFSKDIVEEIQEDLIKLATEGIQQETISSFKDLKEEAFSFLNKMDNLYKVFEQNQLNKLKQMAQNAENSKKIFEFLILAKKKELYYLKVNICQLLVLMQK